MDKLVSVVVPIYNVDEFLEECIESILSQQYKNIEVILVDDGSTDTCLEICNKYKMKDDRITVIHQANSGLSAARNAGLEIANGEYVTFIDSDDVVSTRMIEILLEIAEKNEADISCCGYQKFTKSCPKSDRVNVFDQKRIEVISGAVMVAAMYSGQFVNSGFVAWNKLYKKKLFKDNNILYPIGKIYEDTYVTYKLFYYSAKVAIIDECLYYYRLRVNSIMANTQNKSVDLSLCKNWVESALDAVVFFESKNEQNLESLALNAFCVSTIVFYGSLKKSNRSYKKYIYNSFFEIWNKYKNISLIPLHKRLVYNTFIFFPSIVGKGLWSIKNR